MIQNSHGFNTSLQDVDTQYAWINDMILARHQLLKEYMELVAKCSVSEKSGTTSQEVLPKLVTDFCGKLIDYVSKGHFDLYPKIISLIEKASGRSLSIAQRVLPRIEHTTEYLMDINDRYAENVQNLDLDDLRQDLVTVGSCMEQRFKNEDRLIIGLKLVHTIVSTS